VQSILYIDCLVKELDINNNTGNPTYTSTLLSKEEILSNHKSVISSCGLSIKVDYVDLHSLYWIPKLHKCPYKERYIAGYAPPVTVEAPDHCTFHSQRWTPDLM